MAGNNATNFADVAEGFVKGADFVLLLKPEVHASAGQNKWDRLIISIVPIKAGVTSGFSLKDYDWQKMLTVSLNDSDIDPFYFEYLAVLDDKDPKNATTPIAYQNKKLVVGKNNNGMLVIAMQDGDKTAQKALTPEMKEFLKRTLFNNTSAERLQMKVQARVTAEWTLQKISEMAGQGQQAAPSAPSTPAPAPQQTSIPGGDLLGLGDISVPGAAESAADGIMNIKNPLSFD